MSLGIHPVWSEFSLCAQWVAKDPSFLQADSEHSDQSGRMPRLIRIFAGHTCRHFVCFVTRRLISSALVCHSCLPSPDREFDLVHYTKAVPMTKSIVVSRTSYSICRSGSSTVLFTLCHLTCLYSFPVWRLGQDVESDCISLWPLPKTIHQLCPGTVWVGLITDRLDMTNCVDWAVKPQTNKHVIYQAHNKRN